MTATSNGFQIEAGVDRGGSELFAGRGLAGYGLARALRMLLDALAGLSALHDTHGEHARPFAHGELVPALLRVDESGVTRLIPLAPWHTSAPGMPAAEQRWAHLAPERLLGDAIDPRADVFSAGVLLWEALAGRRLFAGCSVDEIITRLMGGKTLLPQLPPELAWAHGLEAVASRALSVDPAKRYADGAELADAIGGVAAEHVASHVEVAAFFGARDPHARPSVIESLVEVPTHNSSLSALVAPVQAPELAALTEQLVERGASGPLGRRSKALWAVASGALLLAVLGVCWAALSNAKHGDAHAAAGVPLSALPAILPSAPPAAAPPISPAIPGPVTSAAPSVTEPAEPAPSVSEAGSGPSPHAKPAKPAKGLKATKGSAPKLRAPTKGAAGRDKEAELYGI